MRHPRVTLATFVGAVLVTTAFQSALVHRSVLPGGAFSAELVAQTGLRVTRGPYLQMGTSSGVVIRWRTSGPSDSQVLYGPDQAHLIWSAVVATSTTEHLVALSGLAANTTFYYSVGSTTQVLAGGDANHFFITSPLSGTAAPTRIWVLGDSGTADANAASVRDGYYGFAGSRYTNLWLMLGDNANNAGLDTEYQAAVFDMYPATLRQSVLWPTIGNHDIANTPAQTGPYYDIFTLPKSGEAGGLASGTEAYYSFDYANIHFICLDSFDVDLSASGPMWTWLANDVASTSQRWLIAFWHHPPYSHGSHNSDIDFELTQMRQNANPILEAAGVDLVLSGHSHSYERSFLIDGHYGQSSTFSPSMKKDGGSGRVDGSGAYRKPAALAPHAGAVYTVAGSSGINGGGTLDYPAMFVSLNVMGSFVLDVNDGRLDAQFLDNRGIVEDHFTILKGSAASPNITSVTPGSGTVGTTVTIAGNNFGATAGTSTVRFNGTLATPSGWSDASIGVPVPSGATTGPVVVTVNGAASNGVTFTVPSPTITSVTPTSGAVGTTVTIGGSGFGATAGASNVRFNGTLATPSSWSDASIGVPVPSGATTGPVVVTVNGVASNGVGFTVPSAAPAAGSPAGPPVAIGNQIAGTFADATGHSAQSHLVYAANAGVWWLFTLTSTSDSQGGTNHIIKTYHSNGPDLAAALWSAAADSPGASTGASVNCATCFMGGGRALGVAYLNNAPTDVVHAEVAMAFDGQNGLTGHIRATVTATSISWESWNYHDEPAATWTMPRAVTLGVSNGKNIHSGGPILQQEVDANARVSTRPDTGATWTTGFSNVSVIDNSMIHQSNSMAFTPLANNSMLAVFDNGGGVSTCFSCGQTGVPEPQLTNLGYRKSNADGSWPGAVPGSQGPGDGKVFSTEATIVQNDWTLVGASTTAIYTFRRNATGSGVDAATYNATSNTWTGFSAPPLFAAGQSLKSGAGLFGVAVGSNIRLFVINTDLANSILSTTYDGTAWTLWTTVPGTETGQHARAFISGYPIAAANQIGLIWTEGATQFGVFTTSVRLAPPDSTPPSVSILTPANGSSVLGAVSVTANASDNVGVTSVQFQIDGVNQGSPQTTSPYGLTWDSTTVPNSPHSIGAIAADAAGNTSSAIVTVTVRNAPRITTLTPPSGLVGTAVTIAGTNFGTTVGTVTFNGTAATPTNWNDASISVPVPSGATTGPVVVTVNGLASNGVTFTMTPSITSLTPSSGVTGTVVTIAGTSFGVVPGTSTVRFNGTAATASSWSDTSLSVPVPNGATSGPVVVTVNGVASNSMTFTVTNPRITTLAPMSGPVGTAATITGTNFGTIVGTVTFNGTAATPTNWNDTSLSVPVPSGATTGPVVVTANGQASNGVTFTVTPSITSLTPSLGATGTVVTIAGTSFGASAGTSTVRFNSTLATPTSWSDTSLSVPVPNGATTGPVVVTVNGVASNSMTFTVTNPQITTLAPPSGPVGTAVTITGTNFGTTVGTVTFNGTAATPTNWNDTSISVPVPSGATTGPVVVTVNGLASNGVTFTMTPSITSLTPSSGATGTVVTIAGTSFGAAPGTSTVRFNGTAATASSWSNTSIGVPVPSGATTGPVVVTVNGQASNGLTFTVNSPPAPTVDKVIFSDGRDTRTTAAFNTPAPGDLLVAFVASDGPTSGGQSVTVSGAGLTWTLVKRSNGRLGTSEIWQAKATTTQLSNVTVRSSQRFTGYDQSLTVVAFGNAAGAGASVAASAASGAPSVSLTTTKAASLVYGVGNDWDKGVGRTLGANQTMVHQWVDSNTGDTFWVQAVSGATGSAGTLVLVNAIAPTNDQWNLAAVEILLK